MKLKKILIAVLTLTMLFVLAACQNSKTPITEETPSSEVSIEQLQIKMNGHFDQMNAVIDAHEALWNLLLTQDGDNASQVNSTYMETLLEKYGDLISDEDQKALKEDVEKIRSMEIELEKLEKQYYTLIEKENTNEKNSSSESFPTFEGMDLDGSSVDSSSLFGDNKVTVVNFWFSSCAACVEELEALNALNERLKEQGGAVIGINTDTLGGDKNQIAEAKMILEQKGAVYQNVWFDKNSDAGAFSDQLLGFPVTYVVDSSGRIVGKPLMGGINDPAVMEQLQTRIDMALGNN